MAADRPNEVPEGELKEAFAKAPSAKKEIDAMSQKVAAQYSGSVAKAPLKSWDRALEKVKNEYGGDASKIKDLARNTIVVPSESVHAALQTLLEQNPQVDASGVKVITAESNQLGYSGINVTVPTESGLPSEIQINSPKMIYAKESPSVARSILGQDAYNQLANNPNLPPGGQGHVFYEQWRSMPRDSAEAQAIAEASKQYYDAFRR
jgi:hypothetical protein